MAQKKSISIRIDEETDLKLKRLIEIRNIEQTTTGKSTLNQTEAIIEAINFYYAYLVDTGSDNRINKIYEAELTSVLKQHFKPVYSQMNIIKYNMDILNKSFNIIYNQLDSYPNEEDIERQYPEIFQLTEFVQSLELKKVHKLNNE